MVISYFPEGERGRSLNMHAEVCNEHQRTRATDFLLGRGEDAIRNIAEGNSPAIGVETRSTRNSVTALALGASWREVRPAVGPATGACKYRREGFVVVLPVEREGDSGETNAILIFDREQRLVEKKFGSASSVLEICYP